MKALAFAFLVTTSAVHAQFKCVAPDGAVTLQQTPCAAKDTSTQLKLSVQPVTPGDRRAAEMQNAIAMGRIMIGMTRAELDRAMRSQPTKVNASLYASAAHDQLIYEQSNRTLYVYTENGIVTAIQDTPHAPKAQYDTVSAPVKACPSAREIRDIEIEQSKNTNRYNDRLQVELARQLAEARACGR